MNQQAQILKQQRALVPTIRFGHSQGQGDAERQQDFEWYPTTYAMLKAVREHAVKHLKSDDRRCRADADNPDFSVLDCGAGEGTPLAILAGPDGKRCAIEKSLLLLDKLPPDVLIVGTEFMQTTLVDKMVDMVFSNPPYSQFEAWAEKIIREANADGVYLILPDRWKRSEAIKEALEVRDTTAKVIHIDTFDSPDAARPARANVDILYINLQRASDAFSVWFDATFPPPDATPDADKEETGPTPERINHELVAGRNLVEVMEQFYQDDLQKLHDTYAALTQINPALLAEFAVDRGKIMDAVQLRLEGLKDVYWKKFFDQYAPITDKLTKNSREALLSTIHGQTHVDFTAGNIYAITAWVCRNANDYFDKQLIEVVDRLVTRANIKHYKSNKRLFENNEWRYNRKPDNLSHYALELRLIISRYQSLVPESSCQYERYNGLTESAHDFVKDLLTVAANLGYTSPEDTMQHRPPWESGRVQRFVMNNKPGTILFEVKAYLNGNLHIKFNKHLLLRLNVEFGRLNGWIGNVQQASEELNVPPVQVADCFKANFKLKANTATQLLLGGQAIEPEPFTPEKPVVTQPAKAKTCKATAKAPRKPFTADEIADLQRQFAAQLGE